MKTVVVSVGGSVLCSDRFDAEYTMQLLKTLNTYCDKKTNIALVCGGGTTARKYIADCKQYLNATELDHIGIAVTNVHAQCVHSLGLSMRLDMKRFTVVGGTSPGHSTDYVAVEIAQKMKANIVINISNIAMIYTKHPKNKDAKPCPVLSWNELQKIVGNTFHGGDHVPFDPYAIQRAKKAKLMGIFLDNDIQKLIAFLKYQTVQGTIVL